MDKISIIIPVYNVESYIDRCMESILAQDYENIEVLLVDDGSNDNSGYLCDKYAQKDNRVKSFHKPNGGVSSARNFGIAHAEGKYISFVDPDDWLERDTYKNIIEKFDENTDAVFFSYYEDFDDSERIEHNPVKSGKVSSKEALFNCLIGMGYGYFTSVWNKVFRKSALDRTGVEFEKYSIAEDELWLTKVLNNFGDVYLLPEKYYHWYQRQGSALRAGHFKKWYSALEAKKLVADCLKGQDRLYDLACAKLYDNTFDIAWQAYAAGDKETYRFMKSSVAGYKNYFIRNENFSRFKKLRFFVMGTITFLNLPERFVGAVGKINRYRIKKIIGKKP